jgi:hypothetical protein
VLPTFRRHIPPPSSGTKSTGAMTLNPQQTKLNNFLPGEPLMGDCLGIPFVDVISGARAKWAVIVRATCSLVPKHIFDPED